MCKNINVDQYFFSVIIMLSTNDLMLDLIGVP